jgi:hypothetical protein
MDYKLTPRTFSNSHLLAWLAALLFIMMGCAATPSSNQYDAYEIADTWGIEITSVRMSAGGHMIDFRYRVLDAEKAASLFVRSNKPYLIDQKSEKVLSVPNMGKVGPLRNSNKPIEDRIYWMFFGNSGGYVQAGSLVTVTIGDFRVENIVVQ